ncbi:MAG TPA: peptidoglycan-binding protein [Acidimicrobiia bacterium]|nr:peptidoglycan-binding protein [Acidimicrobiia bacterium]
MRSRRQVVAGVAGLAGVAMAVGFAAASQIVSPSEAAARARPPAEAPVTVPVERKALQSQVVTRGDTAFDGAIDVRIETGGLETPAVVTGRVPEVGATVGEGDVLLEVAGRPVIALTGGLPTYRTLRPGSTGPDVTQLEETLARLGLRPGAVDGTYDAATAGAVARLYNRVGYEAPTAPDSASQALTAAQGAEQAAAQALNEARAALQQAQAGATASELLAAQAEVNAARRTLDEARASGDPSQIAAATDQLAIAEARQREVAAPRDTAAARAAVQAAERQYDDAKEALTEAQAAVAVALPAAEVVFLPSLPRRVDQLAVERGDVLEGVALKVSGADLLVSARVSSADRQLLSEGMRAVIEHAGTRVEGAITALRRDETTSDASASTATGFEVVIRPDSLTAQQVEVLRGANVKVTIPIQATNGEVLAVPLAALSAGPGGQSRVEVVRADGRPELVPVEVGLSAGGYAEIRGAVSEGDLVVVGRSR